MAIGFPVAQLMNAAESEIVHQIPDLKRNHDRLARSDLAEGFSVEMIEVCVGDEDEIDLW
jgi:hypothetical protein